MPFGLEWSASLQIEMQVLILLLEHYPFRVAVRPAAKGTRLDILGIARHKEIDTSRP